MCVRYDINPTLNEYENILKVCEDDELKNILKMCKSVHDYFEEHFTDCNSAEKSHYHLHLAQEAISEYILDKSECLI